MMRVSVTAAQSRKPPQPLSPPMCPFCCTARVSCGRQRGVCVCGLRRCDGANPRRGQFHGLHTAPTRRHSVGTAPFGHSLAETGTQRHSEGNPSQMKLAVRLPSTLALRVTVR